jgi:hypothetical protein
LQLRRIPSHRSIRFGGLANPDYSAHACNSIRISKYAIEKSIVAERYHRMRHERLGGLLRIEYFDK